MADDDGHLGQDEHPIRDGQTGGIRWRWYHFYFLLALIDLIVIVASLGLYHSTLTSYERALGGLSDRDEKQHWITQLRLAVIELNAPGNDVFESRDVAAERARFEAMRKRTQILSRRDREFAIDLNDVRMQIAAMELQERSIFEAIDNVAHGGVSQTESRQALSEATVSMAMMDRHLASAMAGLSVIEKNLQSEQSQLLGAYGDQLQRSAAFEKYFLVIVVLILAAVFWYGRKLQRLHEEMIENQQRAVAERHERLASVGEVCSAVAHGIRNPLAAITSSAQLAIEFGTLDDSTRLRLVDVLSESKRLDQRITRLLDFAHGGAKVKIPYDVCQTIRQAIEEVSPNIEQRNIRLTTHIESKVLTVRGHPDEFAQSIIELIANALDHLDAGGSLMIRCARNARQPGEVVIDVIDDGPGIPTEIRSRVFDLFFTTKAQGNGIGLASVKRTFESQDGRVSLEQCPTRGTHIRGVLPLDGPS